MASFPEFVITRNISSQFVIACDLGINAHHQANIRTTDRAARSHIGNAHSARFAKPCMSAQHQYEASTWRY